MPPPGRNARGGCRDSGKEYYILRASGECVLTGQVRYACEFSRTIQIFTICRLLIFALSF